MSSEQPNVQHLKEVSRIKHLILSKYLTAWSAILGSRNSELCYFDCYAGPGIYELQGQFVEGSPIIAVQTAKQFLQSSPTRKMSIVLFEDDPEQYVSLERELVKTRPYGERLDVRLLPYDAKQAVPSELSKMAFVPTFFMIDPYAHPLTIPIINSMLRREKTEALINFMFYRINMDAENPKVQHHLDEMFGNTNWRSQAFLSQSGVEREQGFLEYFCSCIDAKYHFPFRIKFDREDRLSSNRTKYYLIHVSNHPKAVLLMKEVMWPLGDEAGTFEFGQSQRNLISSTPSIAELQRVLLDKYKGRTLSFDAVREETWDLPFIEKHYREAIKAMFKNQQVEIIPVTSKTTRGLREADRVRFIR